MPEPVHVETVIIGGGQAGLVVGRHLARRVRPFLILPELPGLGPPVSLTAGPLRAT